MQTQQGQLRLSKLASPTGKTNPFPFLKLLASKMTLNQIGVIKVDYAHHKSDLAYKDDQGEKHTVEKSDVYYFVYIVEEEKSKANSLPGQNNTTVPLLANFDQYEQQKQEATVSWNQGDIENAKDTWLLTYKQIKCAVPNKNRLNMSQEAQNQYEIVKTACITNTLKACWKLQNFKEGLEIFLKFLVENQKNYKFLDAGFEFMVKLSTKEEFDIEISKLKIKFLDKDKEYFQRLEELEKKYGAKFMQKKKKDEDWLRNNFQKSMWNSDQNQKYEENEQKRNRMNGT